MRIGIDLMGSDRAPALLFRAVVQAAEKMKSDHILCVIASSPVIDELRPLSKPQVSIQFVAAEDSIVMSDDPLTALRQKKNSSLVIGMRMLKKHQIDAFVSCGNTGALVASAALLLPRLPGVTRPGLLAMLPTEKGSIFVLDAGGNVSCKAQHLVQFAYLGAAFQRAMKEGVIPAVGLLNVGAESKKGTKEVRQAYDLLLSHARELTGGGMAPYMNFVGNVEGQDVFQGAVDVLITDGFAGNVFIKTAEGIASLLFKSLKTILDPHLSKTCKQALSELERQFSDAEYPGAIVCGVEGIVIKVHGNVSEKALFNSILGASNYIKKGIIANIKTQLQV